MRTKLLYLLLLICFATGVTAQTLVDPHKINWPSITGHGVPTATCPSATIPAGLPYIDVDSNIWYHCGLLGWSVDGYAGQAELDAQTALTKIANLQATLSTASGTVATVIASGTQSGNANSTAGTKASHKMLAACYSGYDTTTNTLLPSAAGGNRYCTSAIQDAAVAVGGPTLGFVSGTTNASIAIQNSGNAGGNFSPSALTVNFGQSGNSNFCTGDPYHDLTSGMSGLNLPGCVANSSEFYSQTTDSTHAGVDTLVPTTFVIANGDKGDHVVREIWWRQNTLSSMLNFEFDTNYHASTDAYYGWGFQYNNQKHVFQVCPQTCSPWETVQLVDPSGANPTITTYTLVQSHVYHIRIFMHRGSVATCTTATSPGNGCAFYDQMYLQDVTAGTPGVLYNIQYSANGSYTLCPPGVCPGGTGRVTVNYTAGTTPNFTPVSYPTWTKNQYGTQIQLDEDIVNATVSADIDSDSWTAYQVTSTNAQGDTTTQETAGDLMEVDYDGGSDSSYAAVGSPTPASVAYSGTGAMEFNASTEYEQANVTACTTCYWRGYIMINQPQPVNLRILDLYNGTTEIGNIYLNGVNDYPTFHNVPGANDLPCQVNVADGNYHLIELYWLMGSGTSGTFSLKIDGSVTCNASTGQNTGTNSVSIVRWGVVNAPTSTWDINMDNLGLSAVTWLGPVTFTTGTPAATFQTNLGCTKTGSGSGQVITCPGTLNLTQGYQVNGANLSSGGGGGGTTPQSVTVTGTANLGTGGSAACDTADGFTCDSVQGVVVITTGSGSVTNGDFFTVAWTTAMAHKASALFSNVRASGVLTSGNVNTDATTSTTTQLVMYYSSTAPAVNTTFKVKYHID